MDLILYQGEDFCLAGTVDFDPADRSQSLDDYDVVVKISTTESGKAFICYTEQERGDLTIRRGNDNAFVIDFPNTLTSSLSPGPLFVSIALVYRAAGTRSITEAVTPVHVRSARIKRDEI